MKQLLDHLNRWTKYKKGLCRDCQASCCYMPVELTLEESFQLLEMDDFVKELSEKEQLKLVLANEAIKRYTPSTKKLTLAVHPDGRCWFLDAKSKQCTRYDLRPSTCRQHPQVGPRPGFCAYLKKEKK